MTHTLNRRALAASAGALLAAPALVGREATAQTPSFFRIGTGSAGGTYYPIGGIVANAISCPPGSNCNVAGATDGVPGMVAVAQATQGSVQNVNLIQSGNAESGFEVQSRSAKHGRTTNCLKRFLIIKLPRRWLSQKESYSHH